MVTAFCGHCGVRAEEDDAFCTGCGTGIRRSAPAVEAEAAANRSSDDRIALQHGLRLLAGGDSASAKALLQKLVDEHPDWAVARAYLGIACLRLIQVADARDHCEAAVRLDPDSFICRTKYAEFLTKLGFYDQAMAQCDKALALPAPDQASEMAARELRSFCKGKAKGIFYRQIAPPSRIRARNLLPRRFLKNTQPNPVERGL